MLYALIALALTLTAPPALAAFGDDDVRQCIANYPDMIEHCHDPGYTQSTYQFVGPTVPGEEYSTFLDVETIAGDPCAIEWRTRFAAAGTELLETYMTADGAPVACTVGPSTPMWDCPECDTEAHCMAFAPLGVSATAAEIELVWAALAPGDWMLRADQWASYDWNPDGSGCNVFRDYGDTYPSIVSQVPEPSRAWLLGSGLLGLWLLARRR